MTKIFDKIQLLKKNNPNLLINGNFDIWQRGSSFFAGGFTADRWHIISSGSNKASRLAGNIGLDNATNCIRLTTLSSGSWSVLSQTIDSDSTIDIRGQTVTLSFYAKIPSDSNWTGPIYGNVYYSTNFDNIVNGKIEIIDAKFSGTLGAADSWTLYKNSFTIPNNASTLLVEIYPSGGLNTNSIIDIGKTKLELGNFVTNFDPSLYNDELNKCKKFYQKVDATLKAGTGAGKSNRQFGVNIPLVIPPRSSNPKIIISQNNNILIDSFSASLTANSYLSLIASTKNLYSELNLQLIIDDEILYGKEPEVINSASIIRGSGKVDIDWNPPNNSDITISYGILYGNTPDNITNLATFTDSSGSITGLIDSSPYYFKLYSVNSYGQSPLSNIFEVAPAYSVPSGLTSLTGVWGFDTTYLSWDGPNNNGGSPITGYRIDRSMYSNFPDVEDVPDYNSTFYTSGSARSFSISKFIPELTSTGLYYFRVAAMNLAGTGTPSTFTLSKTIPSAPTGLSTTVGDGYVTINYFPPTGNGGLIIQSVNIEKSISSGFALTTGSLHVANYQPITLSGLTNSVNYYFRMRAYNASGYGPYSSTVLAMPNKPVTVPNAPQSISASWVDDDTVQVLMLAPTDDGGTPIINYTVYSSSGSGFSTNLTTSITQNSIPNISFDVPITGNYSTFYFRAKANNSVGSSAYSPTGSLAKQSPNAPTLTNILPGDTSATIQYSKPISRGSSITGYLIDYSTSSNFSSSTTTTSTTLSKVITGLTNNTTYYCRVRAANSVGTGNYSNTISFIPVSPYSVPGTVSCASIYIIEVPFLGNFNMLANNLSNLNNISLVGSPGNVFGIKITTPYSGGTIYGSNPYSRDSDIRTAAIHAGALTPAQTGIVYLWAQNGLSYYSGVTRNGLTSSNLGSSSMSYQVIGSNVKTSCNNFTYGTATGVATSTHVPYFGFCAPNNNGGLPITGYEIQFAADSAFSSQLTTIYRPGNVTSAIECITHSGVDLHGRVRAINTTGAGPWVSTPYSTPAIKKGIGAPQPPTGLIASAIGTTGISLSWSAPSGPIGSGFDTPSNISYRLQYWNQASPTAQTSVNYSGVLSATIPIGGPGTYTLQLQTKNSVYFSNSNNTVVSAVSVTKPTSWVFSYNLGIYPGTSAPTQSGLRDGAANSLTSTWGSHIGYNNFLTADFGSVKTVSSITIGPIDAAYGGWGWSYLNGALLQYSTDNINWTNLTTINAATILRTTSYTVNINARYIRVIMAPYNWLGVGEFYFS